MRRRKFITLLGSAAVAWPLTARAQKAKIIPKIGYLTDEVISDPFDSRRLVLSGLHELGYLDGQNIILEYRSSEGRDDQLPALAADLVSLHVDIILAIGTSARRPHRRPGASPNRSPSSLRVPPIQLHRAWLPGCRGRAATSLE